MNFTIVVCYHRISCALVHDTGLSRCTGMAWHGIAWHCMALHGIAWHCMALHGIAWHCLALLYLKTKVVPWGNSSNEFHYSCSHHTISCALVHDTGLSRCTGMAWHGIAWHYMALHGIAWCCLELFYLKTKVAPLPMNFTTVVCHHTISCALVHDTGLSRCTGITWHCMALHGITWHYMALHGMHGIAWHCMVLFYLKTKVGPLPMNFTTVVCHCTISCAPVHAMQVYSHCSVISQRAIPRIGKC